MGFSKVSGELWAEGAADLRLQSADCRYGMVIRCQLMTRILKHCEQAGTLETGGILTGFYSSERNWAFVTGVSGPPKDSALRPTWFLRGTHGLQYRLNHLWRSKRQSYLGEWHFHPGASPQLSNIDRRQMEAIASSTLYACPEPILLIIGGWLSATWQVSVTVHPAFAEFVRLMPCRPET